jgi:hypothetical protein
METTKPTSDVEFDRAITNAKLSSDAALRGYVDSITCDLDGSVQVRGWVSDANKGSSDIAVLIFGDGRYWGSTVPNMERSDVTKALKLHALFQTPGFAATFAKRSCDGQCPRFTSIAVKGNAYLLLPSVHKAGSCDLR